MPKPIPSFKACCRNTLGVRFICFEIFATGVRASECLRKSACIFFVHATFGFLELGLLLLLFLRRQFYPSLSPTLLAFVDGLDRRLDRRSDIAHVMGWAAAPLASRITVEHCINSATKNFPIETP